MISAFAALDNVRLSAYSGSMNLSKAFTEKEKHAIKEFSQFLRTKVEIRKRRSVKHPEANCTSDHRFFFLPRRRLFIGRFSRDERMPRPTAAFALLAKARGRKTKRQKFEHLHFPIVLSSLGLAATALSTWLLRFTTVSIICKT